ncbi:MAG: hypothetical protein DRJ40_06180 [Thermoprotei archaeon]|nr:MAG: hypothetical protein DRJ40_06180 [Thermoprotei archaeon]
MRYLSRVVPGIDVLDEVLTEARYLYASKFCRKRAVLDLGCGYCIGLKYVCDVARYVLAIDRDRYVLRTVTKILSEKYLNLSTVCCVAEKLPLRKQIFDTVLVMDLIEHVAQVHDLLTEIKRVCKVGGIAVFSTPNADVTRRNPHHVREYRLGTLLTLLSKYFTVKQVLGQVLVNRFLAALSKLGIPVGAVMYLLRKIFKLSTLVDVLRTNSVPREVLLEVLRPEPVVNTVMYAHAHIIAVVYVK